MNNGDFYADSKRVLISDRISKIGKSLDILEVGCGGGELSVKLAKMGHRVTAVDKSYDSIKKTVALRDYHWLKFMVVHSSLRKLPFNGEFDVVIAMDVLEHIYYDEKAFAKLFSLLKPNGMIILTVPAHSELFGYHDKALDHHRRYSLDKIKLRLSPFFSEVKTRWVGGFLLPVCLWYSVIRRKPYPIEAVGKNWLVLAIGTMLMWVERKLNIPFGISILAEGRKRDV